jgi:hypothetical protein
LLPLFFIAHLNDGGNTLLKLIIADVVNKLFDEVNLNTKLILIEILLCSLFQCYSRTPRNSQYIITNNSLFIPVILQVTWALLAFRQPNHIVYLCSSTAFSLRLQATRIILGIYLSKATDADKSNRNEELRRIHPVLPS